PFGWDFDVVRLLVVSLLRAGRIVATSQGQELESAQAVEVRNALGNNSRFRQATFRPKQALEFHLQVEAAERYRDVFGAEVAEIEQGVLSAAIQGALEREVAALETARGLLVQDRLPGAEPLRAAIDQVRSIRSGRADQAILAFNGAYREIKEAIKRAGELQRA